MSVLSLSRTTPCYQRQATAKADLAQTCSSGGLRLVFPLPALALRELHRDPEYWIGRKRVIMLLRRMGIPALHRKPIPVSATPRNLPAPCRRIAMRTATPEPVQQTGVMPRPLR